MISKFLTAFERWGTSGSKRITGTCLWLETDPYDPRYSYGVASEEIAVGISWGRTKREAWNMFIKEQL